MAYATQSHLPERHEENLELSQHVLKFMKTTNISKDVKNQFGVSLEFRNDENGFCVGTISGPPVAMVAAKVIIEQKEKTFKTKSFPVPPELCKTLLTIPQKTIIGKLRERKVWAGWHVCTKENRVDVCCGNVEDIDKAYRTIIQMADALQLDIRPNKSSEEINCSEDRWRYLSAIFAAKQMKEKHSVEIKFDLRADKLQFIGDGHLAAARAELENFLKPLCRDSVELNPVDQSIARELNYTEVVALLNREGVRAGWSFKQGYLSVCSDNGSNVARAREVILNLIRSKHQPIGRPFAPPRSMFRQNPPNLPNKFPAGPRQLGNYRERGPCQTQSFQPFDQQNPIPCREHVQKYLKGKGTSKLLEEKYDVKLEFDSANDVVRLGQNGNRQMACEELKSIITFTASDSSPLTKQQKAQMESLAHKDVIAKFKKSCLVAGYVVRSDRLWVCSDSPSNTAKAIEVIIGMLLEAGNSGSELRPSDKKFKKPVGQVNQAEIDVSIGELRYLKAIGRDKDVSKKYEVEVRVKENLRKVQISGSNSGRVDEAENELKNDIGRVVTNEYPMENILIQCLLGIKYADIVQALKSSGVSAGWEFMDDKGGDKVLVCGKNDMAVGKAATAISSLVKRITYPDEDKLSNAQLKSCETDGWFEVEDKLKEDNVHIRVDPSLAQVVFVMPFKQRHASIIRRLKNFFDPHTQRKHKINLPPGTTKLLQLNKNDIEDSCQLEGGDNVLMSFSEQSCQLESFSAKSLDHAQQKLETVIGGIWPIQLVEDRAAMITWLQSADGRQKLEDLSNLTGTTHELEIIGTKAAPKTKDFVKVVDGDISTIMADGIMTGRGILQQTIEKACGQKLQRGLQHVQLANGVSRWVFHVEIGSWEKDSTVPVLKKRIIEALEAFSQTGVKTVALPAIGTGNLEFPRKELAVALVSAVEEFIKSNQQTSLQKVTLVSYRDADMKETFKVAVKQSGLQPKLSKQATVTILGLNADNVKTAELRLRDEMDEKYMSKTQDFSRFSTEMADQVVALAISKHVDVEISDTKATTLSGLKDDVYAVIDKITELRTQLAEVQYPSNWCSKAVDRGQVLVPLNTTSSEYKRVKDLFTATSSSQSCAITEVSRVQNVELHLMYEAYKTKISKETGPGGTVERELWHGTDANSVQKICETEFNRSYAGKNGVAYGQGSYFSTETSYSINYSKGAGDKYIILAKVATGKWVLGNSSMKTVPEGYHSTTNSSHTPTIFVVYKDPAAYPAYLIKFRC